MRRSCWSQPLSPSPKPAVTMIAPPLTARSDLDLAAELNDPVRRQAEELHRAFRVAQHPGEELLAPDRHARPRRGDQGLAGEEEARVHHLELRPAAVDP